jgi:hypothetical protein
MKKVMLISWCLLIVTIVEAQTFSEWFRQKKTQIEYYTKQIAALKLYNELLLEGYGIVRNGLQVAHDLRKGEFDLHHDYFQSLRSVNGALKTDQAAKTYADILQECEAVRALAERLPAAQREYVYRVINILQQKAEEMYHQYERITTNDQYQLKDDERLRQINATTYALHEQYVFVKRFYYRLQKMLMQEARESNDVKGLENIYLP